MLSTYMYTLRAGGAPPLCFVNVETECDGVVTSHSLVDERLLQRTRRDNAFTTASSAGMDNR